MFPKRIEEMTSFMVMDVLEKAVEMERLGIHIIHLEVGEPDFDTPACIKEAAVAALTAGDTHYTHSQGYLELREAIGEYTAATYGVTPPDPNRIFVTSGTSPAMFALFSVLLSEGDRVILSDPHYACYPNYIRHAGGIIDTVPVYETDGFQLHPRKIREKTTDRTRAVFINSPSNPTGTLLSAERLAEIAELPMYIVSDEIYHGLVYEGVEHSILEFCDPEKTFVLNGFSKQFAMTGLRLGYMIVPEIFVPPLRRLMQNFFISPNAMIQKAGIRAFTCAKADVAEMKRIYNKRRRFIIDRLKAMGFGIAVEPTGAFYVFANAKHIATDSYKLAFDILEKAHVGVAPGIDFGQNGEGFLRFSYANSMENIEAGMNRLETYLKKLPG